MSHFRRLNVPGDVHLPAAGHLIMSEVYGVIPEDPLMLYTPPTPNEKAFCLESDDHELIGVGTLVKTLDQRVALIDDIAVHHDYHGRGYGREIVERIEDQARLDGHMLIKLFPINKAVDFYKHLGYQSLTDEEDHLAKWLD